MVRLLASLFSKNSPRLDGVLPTHVAIIMDGNGRWAKHRHLPRSAGHYAGTEAIKEIVQASRDWGIKYLTIYAFSTENWKRPKEEVDYLFSLVKDFFQKYIADLVKKQTKIQFIGDLTPLPQNVKDIFKEAEEATRQLSELHLNIAFNYGGQQDIVQAAQQIAQQVKEGQLQVQAITPTVFSSYLQTKQTPPVDFVIRTSGEQRISNFLLFQSAYSEFYFTSTLWPDFNRQAYREALEQYQRRHRRFGGL